MPVDNETLHRGLELTLDGTDFTHLGKKIPGKVRDNYLPGNGTRVLVTSDRISAFDRVLGTLPFKGQILNQLSAWWFESTKDVAPNHVLATPDPSVTIAMECQPLPVEWVMRAYVTGVTSTSIWTRYAQGGREFCGHRLPDGLVKNQKLPNIILTPSTKAEKGGHDESVSKQQLLERGVIDKATFEKASAIAHALFKKGQAIAAERGLILVDTKYEMGRAPDGQIVVIDEIHTPDSSRYWFAETYETRMAAAEEPDSFDKEYVRRWLAAEGFTGDGPIPPIPADIRVEASRRYIEAYEMICGKKFVPDLGSPSERILKNLEKS